MRRYYLSRIREVFDPTLGTNVWRHRLQDPEFGGFDVLAAVIDVDESGIPTQAATLCLVGSVDHATLVGDAELAAFPDVPLDMKVSGIHTATKNAAKGRFAQLLGQTPQQVDAVWGNADGLRDVVDYYGRLNDPAFDSNNFSLNDA